LLRELADARHDAFIEPALLQPPGIKPERVLAGHAARSGDQPQIISQVASTLPDRGGMEIEPRLFGQGAEIDVDRGPDAVETCRALFLLALDVPQSVGDELKIETNSPFQQTRAFSTPVSQQVPICSLDFFVSVGSAEFVFEVSLAICCRRENRPPK